MKVSLAILLATMAEVWAAAAGGDESAAERQLVNNHGKYYPVRKPTQHGPYYKTPYPTHKPPTPYPTGKAPTPEPTPYPTPRPTPGPTHHYPAPTYPAPTYGSHYNPYPPPPYPPPPVPRTSRPTPGPTPNPTPDPTPRPTKVTDYPTKEPTPLPTKNPTKNPTPGPTYSPTYSPTKYPTKYPTKSPIYYPTKYPRPTPEPTEEPTISAEPSENPTSSEEPSENPTMSEEPSETPSMSLEPSAEPSQALVTIYDIICDPANIVTFGLLCTFVDIFPDLVELLGGPSTRRVDFDTLQARVNEIMDKGSSGRKLEGSSGRKLQVLKKGLARNALDNPPKTAPKARAKPVNTANRRDGITLFAPTNAAWLAYPGNFPDLTTIMGQDELYDILQFHIFDRQALSFNRLFCGKEREMRNGINSKTFCSNGNKFQIGPGNERKQFPKIIVRNQDATNGIIHTVNASPLLVTPPIASDAPSAAPTMTTMPSFQPSASNYPSIVPSSSNYPSSDPTQ